MNTQTNDQTIDGSTLDEMDALLDGTLDDLADIPEFRPYPIGAHKVKISWDMNHTIDKVYKKKDDESSGLKRFVKLDMTALETVELPAGTTETPLAAGEKGQMLFDLTNEFAQGKFKKLMDGLVNHYGKKTNRELINESQNAEVVVTITQRTDKKTKKIYAEVDNLMVV